MPPGAARTPPPASSSLRLCFRFLDHFILSGTLFDDCVNAVSVLHDVDNTSDHDPILLQLSLDARYIGLSMFTCHAFRGLKHRLNISVY